jgi:hypothetical protein
LLFHVETKHGTCKVYLTETEISSVKSVQNLKEKRLAFLLALMLASVTMIQTKAQQATVSAVPASYTVPNVGMTFNVSVTIQSVNDLYGYEFKLYYPNDILNGTNVAQGPFLKTGGVPTLFDVAHFTDNYNATHGLLNILSLRTVQSAPGVNGSGTLAIITFKSTSNDGPKTLHLADVKLSDSNDSAIPCTTVDAEVTVVPEFPVALILPLLTMLTLVALALGKKIRNPREIFHSV